MPPPPLPRTRRRTALGLMVAGPAALAAAGVAGCDAGAPSPRGGSGSTAGTTPGAAPTPSDEEADEAVLGQAVAAVRNAAALVAATATRHPALADALDGLTTMHRAHHDLLAESFPGEAPEEVPPPDVRARRRRALREVRRHENDLQVLLTGLAVEARSGPFARVLASMAAAVGQRVLLLPVPAAESEEAAS